MRVPTAPTPTRSRRLSAWPVATRPPWLTSGRSLAVAGIAVIAVVTVVLVATNPFGGPTAASSAADNGSPTAITTVKSEAISSQMQVDGTLGYADVWTINVPTGVTQSDMRQADQGVNSAQAALKIAQTTLSTDQQALAQAEAKLTADRLKESSDCAGGNAAESNGAASGPTSGASGSANTSPCASAVQTTTADQTAVTQLKPKVTADQVQVQSAQTALTQAEGNLEAMQASATGYDTSASYTMLPNAGAIVRRGQPLYAISGQPTLLLYGSVSAWRAFRPGMSSGRDVGELNANLRALGYGDLSGDAFTSATEEAVISFQHSHGLSGTGFLPLGSVVFEPAAVRVTAVTPTSGQTVQPGALMTVSSTQHDVTIDLDAANQAQVKVGDRVTVTLATNSTTPGVVSKVGKVATTPSNSQNAGGGSGSTTPTIEVDVRLLHEAAAGTLDQAPVSVSITTNRVSNALVVPVSALLALSGGGYALETVSSNGTHSLIPVTLGIFDDANGTVQVTGSAVHAGQRVVVPSS
jgi:Putative peptidoglycan binding domain